MQSEARTTYTILAGSIERTTTDPIIAETFARAGVPVKAITEGDPR